MVDFNGVTWRVNYGEIAERLQFRVGRKDLEVFSAYFEVSQLSDLITVLQGTAAVDPGVTVVGAGLQAVKVPEGFTTSVSVAPRLDTGTPVEQIRVPVEEVSDLLYALTLFQTSLTPYLMPSDWDLSKLIPVVILQEDGTLITVTGIEVNVNLTPQEKDTLNQLVAEGFIRPLQARGEDITSGMVSNEFLPKMSGLRGITVSADLPSGGEPGDFHFRYKIAP